MCRRDIATAAPAPLIRPDDVDARTAIDTEMVDCPVSVIDGVERAGLSRLCKQAADQSADDEGSFAI
ncbi:hypothetical protein D3C86_2252980 [compost metagenome]